MAYRRQWHVVVDVIYGLYDSICVSSEWPVLNKGNSIWNGFLDVCFSPLLSCTQLAINHNLLYFFSFISSLGHFGGTQVFFCGCWRRAGISTWTHGWGIECALVQTHSWPLACCLEELNVVFVIFLCRPLSQPLTVPLCSYCFRLLHTTCNAPTGLGRNNCCCRFLASWSVCVHQYSCSVCILLHLIF